MDVQGAVKAVQSRVRFAREAAQAFAFDAKTDMAEAWRTGLGVPHFITGFTSFACFAVAAGGTVALSGDFIGKFYGPRECEGCNGWEGVLCRLCNGSGQAPFTVRHSQLRSGEERSAANVAASVVEGRADVAFIPRTVDLGLPLPQTTCPTCAGSGVMKCRLCKGDAWKNKISFTKMCASPTLAWDVVRRNKGVHTPAYPTDHPTVAQFAETLQQPLQGLPEEWQEKLKWQSADALVAVGSGRAARNPVALMQQEAAQEAAGAHPPARPRNWGEERLPELVPLPDISGMKTAEERVAWEEVGRQQAGVKGQALDALWAEDWRKSKEDEILRRKAQAALQALKAEPEAPPQAAAVVSKVSEAPPAVAPTKKGKGQGSTKMKEGQKEAAKKEREEKKALLARRAAEREKAVAEAKRGR